MFPSETGVGNEGGYISMQQPNNFKYENTPFYGIE